MPDVPAYTLTRRRMKSVRVRVAPGTGEVLVSASPRVPVRRIEAFLVEKATWIAAQQAHAVTRPAALAPGPEADALRAILRPLLAELLAAWVPVMGVPEPEWRMRVMRTRWGSCNKEARRVNFSVELARRPRRLVEYVVVHELAHLIEANHGPGFVALMDRHLPDWRSRRAELNR
ncbi:M48 family metallopeptidase [Demequina pelophila]|uniref:M48 family metallopeptidase n=1 Tax=Demequina pelophila TaxID=1638984 RepID=UPI0007860EB2|nr:SprT family zinc-dependent metalloprotease [Demequina pelophila]